MGKSQSAGGAGPFAAIRGFFLSAYEGDSLVSRKQAESLLYTLLAMSGATLIISFVMTDKLAGAFIFGIALVSAALTFLVKFGRAGIASAVATSSSLPPSRPFPS